MQQVANTILAQLGGNAFAMMTGAKDFVGGATALHFSLPARSTKGRANKFRVTLLPSDTYRLEAIRYSPSKLTVEVLETVEGVHCEQLRATFTGMTGLHTGLRG